MAVWRGYNYSELIRAGASPREQWSHYASKVTRIFEVAWADRWNFGKELLGYPILHSNDQVIPGHFVVRSWPGANGSYSGGSTMVAGEPGQPGGSASGGQTMYSVPPQGTMYAQPSLPTMYSQGSQNPSGGPPSVVGGATPYLERVMPAPYASPDGVRFLYATNISNIEGVGIPTTNPSPYIVKDLQDVAAYERAFLTVEYTNLTYSVIADAFVTNPDTGVPDERNLSRYVTIKPKPTTELLKYGAGTWKWSDGGPNSTLPAHQDAFKRESKIAFDITWHQIPLLPTAAVDHAGKINSNLMNIALVNDTTTKVTICPPGILSYHSADVVPLARGIIEPQLYDLIYHLFYFQPAPGLGWNSKFDQFTKRYRPVSSDGTATGVKMFEYADLSALFVPI